MFLKEKTLNKINKYTSDLKIQKFFKCSFFFISDLFLLFFYQNNNKYKKNIYLLKLTVALINIQSTTVKYFKLIIEFQIN